jgi:DNA-directed RNA polymerase specialized sigma24 family protein
MNDFARLLEAQIPRLRRYTRALNRDSSQADDLVQSRLTRAIAQTESLAGRTDLRAWLFTTSTISTSTRSAVRCIKGTALRSTRHRS